MRNLENSFSNSSYLGLFPLVRQVLTTVLRRLATTQNYATEFTKKHINNARSIRRDAPNNGHPDPMAMKLIDAQALDPDNFTDQNIMISASANVGAGSDTTAISLSSVLFYLYRSSRCLEKLREELKSSGIGNHSTFREIQALPYLQAVVKEALRMHPGTGFPLFRKVPKGGAVICDQFFPEDVCAILLLLLLHESRTN